MTEGSVDVPRRRLPIFLRETRYAVAVALSAGLLAVVFPATAALVAVLLLGVYALGDGFVVIVEEFTTSARPQRLARLVAALVSIAIGLFLLLRPEPAQVVVMVTLGAATVAAGGWQLLAALAGRHSPDVAWGAGLAVGALLVVAGVLVITHPVSGRTITTMVVGAGAVAWSVVTLVIASRDRRSDASLPSSRASVREQDRSPQA